MNDLLKKEQRFNESLKLMTRPFDKLFLVCWFSLSTVLLFLEHNWWLSILLGWPISFFIVYLIFYLVSFGHYCYHLKKDP